MIQCSVVIGLLIWAANFNVTLASCKVVLNEINVETPEKPEAKEFIELKV